MSRLVGFALMAFLALVACTGVPNSLRGAGAFPVRSSEELIATQDGGSVALAFTYLANGNLSGMCAFSDAGVPGLSDVAVIAVISQTGAPVIPGRYALGLVPDAPIVALVSTGTFNGVSSGAMQGYSSGGTLTLSTVGTSGASGEFAATMLFTDGGTGSLSGSFDAPFCTSF